MMAGAFWFSDRQWAVIEPLLPQNRPGARRVDDRRVLSGIVHVLRSGCRWQDCPAVYGPPTTIYNRFNRWSRRGVWQQCCRRWPSPSPATSTSSTAPVRRPIARPAVQKGGPGAGDRPLTWRLDDQDPSRRRQPRPPARLCPEPRPQRRRASSTSLDRTLAAGPALHRRRRLRQRRVPRPLAPSRHHARDPQPPNAQAPTSFRPRRLSAPRPRRACLLPPQGLAPRRYTLRQAQTKLPSRRRHRRPRHLVDVTST